jgi:hypothetical protein
MTFFRNYIVPLLIVIVFLIALVAVTIRAFLPGDLLEAAPILEMIFLLKPDYTNFLVDQYFF